MKFEEVMEVCVDYYNQTLSPPIQTEKLRKVIESIEFWKVSVYI